MKHIGFLSHNKVRQYPFDPSSTFIGTLGSSTVSIPNDFIVDASMTTLRTNVYIKTIISLPPIFTVNIFAEEDSQEFFLGSATISSLDPGEFIVRQIDGINGTITFCNLDGLSGVFGTIQLSSTGLIFLAKTLKQDPFAGVTSIIDVTSGESLSGSISFLEGFNVELSQDPGNNSITISASRGSGLGIFCGEDCPEPEECPSCIRTVNGIGPNPQGVFRVSAKNHASIENDPENSRIVIGTQIPSGRLDCTRTGVQAAQGPQGPIGPAGPQGNAAGPFGGIEPPP